MAPLVLALQKHPDAFEVAVCITGQHREMLDQVLKIFRITPDYDLDIMQKGQDLYDVTSRILLGMRKVLQELRPPTLCWCMGIRSLPWRLRSLLSTSASR